MIKTDEYKTIELFINLIKKRVPSSDAVKCFDNRIFDSFLCNNIIKAAQPLPLEENIRIYRSASLAAKGKTHELFEEASSSCVRQMVTDGTVDENFFDFSPAIKSNEVLLSFPLRVNWCGTWTDTPPYCLENGGAVVNAAITINNLLPVKVVLKRLAEPKVILEYSDSGLRREFRRADELSCVTVASDPFSLLKSALAVCGLIPIPGVELKADIFEVLNGGIFLSAGVIDIPKGSGLGTSSILLAACIKGIFEYMGCRIGDAEIFRRVLLAEQIMGTGGGWQDQAGGMTPGIKIATSASGYRQEIAVKQLKVPGEFYGSTKFAFLSCIQRAAKTGPNGFKRSYGRLFAL